MDQVKDQNGNVLADYTNDILRRTRLDYLNETYVTYEYNDADWVTGLYNTKTDQGDVSQFTYTHDQVGNRLSMTISQGTHNYTYDNISQLTHVDYPAGDPYVDKTYNYGKHQGQTSTIDYGKVV